MTSNDLKNFLSNQTRLIRESSTLDQVSHEFDFSNPFDFTSIESEVHVTQSESSTQGNGQSEASNIEPDLDLILDSMSGCRSDSNSINPFFNENELDSDSLSLAQSESRTKTDSTQPQTPQKLSFCPDFNSEEIIRDQDSEFSDIEPTFVCTSDNTFAQALETANQNQEFIPPNQQHRCGPCKELFALFSSTISYCASYGPYHIVHIIWSISYGPYHMVHIIKRTNKSEVLFLRLNSPIITRKLIL